MSEHYVAEHQLGRGHAVYHSSEDCCQLDSAASVVPKERRAGQGHLCDSCRRRDEDDSGPRLHTRLDRADASEVFGDD